MTRIIYPSEEDMIGFGAVDVLAIGVNEKGQHSNWGKIPFCDSKKITVVGGFTGYAGFKRADEMRVLVYACGPIGNNDGNGPTNTTIIVHDLGYPIQLGEGTRVYYVFATEKLTYPESVKQIDEEKFDAMMRDSSSIVNKAMKKGAIDKIKEEMDETFDKWIKQL